MRAGEVADVVVHARPRRHAPAPMLRAVAALVGLTAALLAVTGAWPGAGSAAHASRPGTPTQVLGEQVSRPTAVGSRPVATSPSTTTTTAATPLPALEARAVPVLRTTCADALAYLAAHQAPGFVDSCADGSALGHLGYTCADVAGRCEGQRFIRIACPAPFVYMNEAHNSWVLTGTGSGVDPYGPGTAAEQAACAPHR
jgi:hypothetical protein